MYTEIVSLQKKKPSDDKKELKRKYKRVIKFLFLYPAPRKYKIKHEKYVRKSFVICRIPCTVKNVKIKRWNNCVHKKNSKKIESNNKKNLTKNTLASFQR